MDEFDTEFHPTRVLQNYVADRTVAILVRNPTDVFALGSGVCIRIAERFFLATTGHTIDEVADTERIVLVPPRSSNARLRILDRGHSINDVRNRPDLGWIELDPAQVGHSALKALDLTDLDLSPLGAETPILVTGYPLDMIGDAETLPRLCCTGLLTMPAADGSESGVESSEILIEYPPHNDPIASHVPSPRGVSGGGLWKVPRYEDHPIVWSAELTRLVGIARVWNRRKQLLSGIRVRDWLEFMGREKPELRESIAGAVGDGAGSPRSMWTWI